MRHDASTKRASTSRQRRDAHETMPADDAYAQNELSPLTTITTNIVAANIRYNMQHVTSICHTRDDATQDVNTPCLFTSSFRHVCRTLRQTRHVACYNIYHLSIIRNIAHIYFDAELMSRQRQETQTRHCRLMPFMPQTRQRHINAGA